LAASTGLGDSAVRLRPIFAATGVLLSSLVIVYAAVSAIGHFGDHDVALDDSVTRAQAIILFVALSAHVLAALFAEGKESVARIDKQDAGARKGQ